MKPISLDDAAQRLNVSTKTVRRYIAAGRLTGYRVGPTLIRIDADEVEALLHPIPTVGTIPDRAATSASLDLTTSGRRRRGRPSKFGTVVATFDMKGPPGLAELGLLRVAIARVEALCLRAEAQMIPHADKVVSCSEIRSALSDIEILAIGTDARRPFDQRAREQLAVLLRLGSSVWGLPDDLRLELLREPPE